VNHPIATFKSEDGIAYQIHMGPYWYWLNNGYKLNNETATIKGEVKTVNGINELYPIEVTQNGTTIKLTDDKGIPLWAGYNGNGRGNGRGNGYGWKNGTCKYDSVKCANCVNKGNCCNNNNCCRKGNKGKGNSNGRGNCWRNNSDNSSTNNSNNQNGRGWRQNCPYRNK
jgi:hypothetical protein